MFRVAAARWRLNDLPHPLVRSARPEGSTSGRRHAEARSAIEIKGCFAASLILHMLSLRLLLAGSSATREMSRLIYLSVRARHELCSCSRVPASVLYR